MIDISLPVEIAGIATGAFACEAAAAQGMLELLMARRPFAASCLSVYNPINGEHKAIASVGYDQRVLSHLNGWLVTDDIAYRFYRGQGARQRALKWAEMPFRYRDTFSVQEVFVPAGFREGITLRLHSRDGRYTGDLHISTDDPRFPTTEMMTDEIQCLQTILGNFTDLLRSATTHLSGPQEGGSACVRTLSGEIIGLPGFAMPEPGLCDALFSRFGDLRRDQIPKVFLFRHDSNWFQVHTGVVDGGGRAIVARACTIPYGLTARELEIVDLLISGATNAEIASRVFVARTTISKHLENIFQKMGCSNRTAVVTTALSEHLRRLPGRRAHS